MLHMKFIGMYIIYCHTEMISYCHETERYRFHMAVMLFYTLQKIILIAAFIYKNIITQNFRTLSHTNVTPTSSLHDHHTGFIYGRKLKIIKVG